MQLNDVLIVDDSPTMRMLVSFALGKHWVCDIRHAGNGIEALAEAGVKRPDLMMVDINMPEMDGLELISRVRSTAALKDVPIIVITSEGTPADVQKGMEAGATAYLVKPFQPQKLQAVIDHMFERAVVA